MPSTDVQKNSFHWPLKPYKSVRACLGVFCVFLKNTWTTTMVCPATVTQMVRALAPAPVRRISQRSPRKCFVCGEPTCWGQNHNFTAYPSLYQILIFRKYSKPDKVVSNTKSWLVTTHSSIPCKMKRLALKATVSGLNGAIQQRLILLLLIGLLAPVA